VIDHRRDILEIAERAQTADDPASLMEIATALYSLARILDMKAVLQRAREVKPSPQVYAVQ
jgi:HPt (histidine-containing phosphotransfer) domain-containing protein